jgi:hypothetical protein
LAREAREALLPLLATCASFYLLGQVFPVGALSYKGLAAGFWTATGATVVMSSGGVLAVASAGFGRPSLGRHTV